MAWNRWKPYVSVAQRRNQAKRQMETLKKQGHKIQPVEISGRKIATTFWGQSWCEHLESFSDFENRLPRGRSYVRNGSVCHLGIGQGEINAHVSGSEIYHVQVSIKTLSSQKWKSIKKKCSGQIGTLLELLQGSLSDHIMNVVTDRKNGLFPLSGEMSFECDCPDWADMCKHVAAVLYGVGARLDHDPSLLFVLRGVDHNELIDENVQFDIPKKTGKGSKRIVDDDLGEVFGIELGTDAPHESLNGQIEVKKPNRKKRKIASKKKSTPKSKAARKKEIAGKRATKKKASSKADKKKSTTSSKASLPVKTKKTVKKKSDKKSVKRKTARKKSKRPV